MIHKKKQFIKIFNRVRVRSLLFRNRDAHIINNNIAKLWSAYTDTDIDAHDVAIMMSLLKIARTKLGAVSKDTYIDMSAYGAIAGEIKFKEK